MPIKFVRSPLWIIPCIALGYAWVAAAKESMGNNSKVAEAMHKFDTSLAWKQYWNIYQTYGKEFSGQKLKILGTVVDGLEPELQKLLPERKLASKMTAYLGNCISRREYLIQPRIGKQPRPKEWNELADALVGLEAKFSLATSFRESGIRDSFTTGLESDLHQGIDRILKSLVKLEAEGPEPENVQAFLSPKPPPGRRPGKAAEIREFAKKAGDKLSSWKEMP